MPQYSLPVSYTHLFLVWNGWSMKKDIKCTVLHWHQAVSYTHLDVYKRQVQAFVESTQEYVTGEVKFKLYKGNIIKAGTTSPYSLYSESLASFTTGDLYDHHDAEGFITLFGLPLKVRAMMEKENGIEKL